MRWGGELSGRRLGCIKTYHLVEVLLLGGSLVSGMARDRRHLDAIDLKQSMLVDEGVHSLSCPLSCG